jgi:hypothetical protein
MFERDKTKDIEREIWTDTRMLTDFLKDKKRDVEIDYVDMLTKRPKINSSGIPASGGTYYGKKDMIITQDSAEDHEKGHRKSSHTLDLHDNDDPNKIPEHRYDGTDLALNRPLCDLSNSYEMFSKEKSVVERLRCLLFDAVSVEELRATKNRLIEAMRSGKYTEDLKEKILREIVNYSGRCANPITGQEQLTEDLSSEDARFLVISWEKEFRDPMYFDTEEGMTEEELQQFYENNPEFEDAEKWRERNENEGWINWNIDYEEDVGKNNHCRKLRKEKHKTVVKRHIFRKNISG